MQANLTEQEEKNIADKVADQVVNELGRHQVVQTIRKSQIVSAMVGAAGLALFIVGVEKVFNFLPGAVSILLGLLFLTISGALLTHLRR